MMRQRAGQKNTIECLKSLGITKYEALVYIALLKVPSATASEIHESSGVPRASVYPVLDQLLDKDLVSVSLSAPKRFAAIPPEEAIRKLMSRIERDASEAGEGLTSIFRQRIVHDESSGELIWNLQGVATIRKKLIEMIESARTDIRIIAHARVFSDEVKEALTMLDGRVRTEIVTSDWDGPAPASVSLYINARLPRELDQIQEIIAGGICIVDDRKVLVILGSGEMEAAALFSESEGFVRFFLRYYSLVLDGVKKGTDQ